MSIGSYVRIVIVRQKADWRRTCYFDARIHRKYVDLSPSFQSAHAHRYNNQ